MMRMSVKKLKKIGDPETLLCRAVLINNTLECLRNARNVRPNEMKIETCYDHNKIDTPIHSKYSAEEEQILRSILLPIPTPITPITNREDGYDINDSEDVVPGISNDKNSIVERLMNSFQSISNGRISGSREESETVQEKSSEEEKSNLNIQNEISLSYSSVVFDKFSNNIQNLITV